MTDRALTQTSQLSIRVEPVADPSGRHTIVAADREPVRVGVITEPDVIETDAPDLIQPIVGFRNWRIFRTGAMRGQLCSPHFPVSWRGPVLRAECLRVLSADDLLREQHPAPDPACSCGISACHTPTGEFSTVDFRGVSGIVTVWGRIAVSSEEMRAENARVEALGVYSRWSGSQRRVVAEVADELGVDVVDLHELGEAANDYGGPLPAALAEDERPGGMRERFAALLRSRVEG